VIGASFLVASALAQEPAMTVHHTEVEVATPYARVLAEPTPGALRCLVNVVVAEDGSPIRTSATGCEEPWASAAAATAAQGRWRLRDGQAAPLGFVLPIEGHPIVEPTALQITRHPGAEPTSNTKAAGGTTCTIRLHGTGTGAVDGAAAVGDCPQAATLTAMVRAWTVHATPEPFYGDVSFAIAGDGRVSFRYTVITIRQAAKQRYPRKARMYYPEKSTVECRLRVTIDATGTPSSVAYEQCPELFRRAAKRVVMRSRWYPVEVDGAPGEAQFPLTLTYYLEDAL
jgi:hypothetical protein